jgi:plastocyanin domain-containing protein
MSAASWVVLIAGIAAIVWVNWYFFAAERRAVSAASTGKAQEVEIEVKGGYDPGVVRLKLGVPARLVFNRQETSPCSEEIVIPAFGVKRFLAPFRKTVVEIAPNEPGKFEMTCGMSMLHGTLVVEG